MTLNGEIVLILRHVTKFGSFRAHCVKVVKDIPNISGTEM